MNGRDTRSYVTTALTAAALVLAALASILAGTSHGSARAWWIAVNLLAVTVPMVLYSAALLIGPDRVRACWFELDERSPRALRPVLHEGRAGGPRTTFVEGTVAGDSVFELLTANAHRFCEDIRVDPPPGWDPTHPHDYQTFLAVPVVAGTKAYGLLTVDSLVAGDLTEGDVPLLRLLAGLLADALAYGA